MKRLLSDDSNGASKISKSVLPYVPPQFNSKRARLLTPSNSVLPDGDCVMYWMSRDQRVHDNYALLYAQGLAISKNVPLKVVFNVVPTFLEATIRQFGFMLKGLEEVEQQLREKDIPLILLTGDCTVNIPDAVKSEKAIALVSDFSPLRIATMWITKVTESLNSTNVPYIQVDAHNIVPCWIASPKLEYGARTIRSKIQNLLPEFLTDIPPIEPNPKGSLDKHPLVDWKGVYDSLEVDRTVKEVTWLRPGPSGAREMYQKFVDIKLKDYEAKRNDPNNDVASNLSPYLHFGQISIQRIVIDVKQLKRHSGSTDSFVEEAVIRRELADNFCYYNKNYDSLDSCYDWAKDTLRVHSSDPRSVVYTRDELEKAQSHDDLWNAAQLQMVTTGKMHGFLRMYWAKKILEWTSSPAEALKIAIYLNDKYELDGRDPNGYVGCMWSIGGIHDQGWGERPIFGKIRYMNYEGCKRKFDVKKFVAQYPLAASNAAVSSKKYPKASK